MCGNTKLNGISVSTLGDRKFAFGRAGHALLVDGSDHDTRAIGASQLQYLEEAFVAVFIVGGVQEAFASGHLEAGFHFLPLGGVEH